MASSSFSLVFCISVLGHVCAAPQSLKAATKGGRKGSPSLAAFPMWHTFDQPFPLMEAPSFGLPRVEPPLPPSKTTINEDPLQLHGVGPLFPNMETNFHPKVEPCAFDHFDCGDTLCIPEGWVCDGDEDCLDGRDEHNCAQKNCTADRFRCSNNLCILARYVCDGSPDCLDGSDELNCVATTWANTTSSKASSPSFYHGATPSTRPPPPRRSSPTQRVHHGATPSTRPPPPRHSSPTQRGSSVPSASTTTEAYPCPQSTFKCLGKLGSPVCIPARLVCNVDLDCADGTDEANCPNATCAADQFRCLEPGRCIPKTWACDGERDCMDGSDEGNCTTTSSVSPITAIETTPFLEKRVSTRSPIHTTSVASSPTCKTNEFRCNSGGCIPVWWRCDGAPDCPGPEAEDEAGCPPPSTPSSPTAATTTTTTTTTRTTTRTPSPTPSRTTTSSTKLATRAQTFVPRWTAESKPVLEVTSTVPHDTPGCDANQCAPCLSSTSRCPENFMDFEGLCLWVNPFPRKWLRAREICTENNAKLMELPQDPQLHQRLFMFLRKKALTGLNYWVKKTKGTSAHEISEREMRIPSWMLNGRMTNGEKFPAYQSDCYFLHYHDFKYYKSTDCNDHGGFICLWNGNSKF